MAVNKDRIKLLVNALRSGKYTQGHGCLEQNSTSDGQTKNCCLGVACRVAQDAGVNLKVTNHFDYTIFDTSTSYLPLSVAEWLGFEGDEELGTPDDITLKLRNGKTASATVLNDGGKDFKYIANAFERTFLKD